MRGRPSDGLDSLGSARATRQLSPAAHPSWGVQFTLRSRSPESSLRIVVVLWRFRCFLVSYYSSQTSFVPRPRTRFHLRSGKTCFCKRISFRHFNCSDRLARATRSLAPTATPHPDRKWLAIIFASLVAVSHTTTHEHSTHHLHHGSGRSERMSFAYPNLSPSVTR